MRGDTEGAQSKAQAALVLNIISIVLWMIIFVMIIMIASIATVIGSNRP